MINRCFCMDLLIDYDKRIINSEDLVSCIHSDIERSKAKLSEQTRKRTEASIIAKL